MRDRLRLVAYNFLSGGSAKRAGDGSADFGPHRRPRPAAGPRRGHSSGGKQSHELEHLLL